MGAITEADVERVIAEMVSKGHSGSYQHQAHKSMARLFRDARKARLIAVVPMQDVPAPAEIPTKEIVVPTTAEVAALIATAPDPRVRAFIATLAYTGARSFEVLNVRWSDYDVEAGLMTVTRKGGKLDTIPVVPTLATELAAWRKVQAAEQLAAHWWDDGGWMLSSDCGTHWDKRNARRRFTAVAEKVCPGATPHSMRHAAGTTLLEAGVAPLVVSKLLGHADTRITEKTYQKVRPALAGEGAAALERAIANG
jgi:integrase